MLTHTGAPSYYSSMGRKKMFDATAKQVSLKLSKVDYAAAAALRERMALHSIAGALRYALRHAHTATKQDLESTRGKNMGKGLGGAGARKKGAAFELFCAKAFDSALGTETRRNLQPQGGRAVGSDLVVTRDGLRLPLSIECKHGVKPNPRAALEQCTRDAQPGDYVIAVVRDDHKAPFAVLSLDDLLELLSKIDRGVL